MFNKISARNIIAIKEALIEEVSQNETNIIIDDYDDFCDGDDLCKTQVDQS